MRRHRDEAYLLDLIRSMDERMKRQREKCPRAWALYGELPLESKAEDAFMEELLSHFSALVDITPEREQEIRSAVGLPVEHHVHRDAPDVACHCDAKENP